jgi:hypothetical protein
MSSKRQQLHCQIWKQTAIISLYNITWLVFTAETVCLLRGTDWAFKYSAGLV